MQKSIFQVLFFFFYLYFAIYFAHTRDVSPCSIICRSKRPFDSRSTFDDSAKIDLTCILANKKTAL